MKIRRSSLANAPVPSYGMLYFDHLRGENLSLVESFTDRDKETNADLIAKRESGLLTWNDIYAYQLLTVKYLDYEALKNKILSLRVKYASIAGDVKYAAYLSSRGYDLAAPDPGSLEPVLADYRYLLDEFFLCYAFISAKEELRTKLLRYGASATIAFFVIASTLAIVMYTTNLTDVVRLKFTISTVLLVVFAGMTGAFLSIQQRLQSSINSGDPFYSLSLLTHGWFSIFLSPISGAVFAVVLYLFFVGGLLTGSIFPTVRTIDKPVSHVNLTVTNLEPRPDLSETSETNSNATPAKSNSTQNGSDAVVEQNLTVGLSEFLEQTGPATGLDFALLLIWSFIAGFAERLVPDTLARLVNQKKSHEAAPE